MEIIDVSGRESSFTVTEIFEQCVGCKWTLHILANIRKGVHRPGQLERTADGLTTKVLNERLVKLVRFGILNKISYPEIPPRVEYRFYRVWRSVHFYHGPDREVAGRI